MLRSDNKKPLLLLCTLSMPAIAQGPPALEEIFVTAEKRVETQQEIAASFNVFTSEKIESSGWNDVTDIATLMPSLEVVGVTKTRTSIFIRSIGTNKYDIGTEGSVGVFVDGIYVPRFSSLMQNIVDVERLEILKGPQGTLYGRNTIGGAISLITKDPQEDFSATVVKEIGNEDSWQIGGTVSGSLIEDKLLGYISASAREAGGFRTELNSGAEDDEKSYNIRGKLIYNFTDNVTAKLVIDDTQQRVDAFTGEVVFPPGSNDILSIDPRIPEETRQAEIDAEAVDQYTSRANVPGYTDVSARATNLTLKWEHDDFSLESITGLRDETVGEFVDDDRMNFEIANILTEQESSTWSQEFKFSSEEGGNLTFDDRISWLVGAFFYQDTAQRSDAIQLGAQAEIAGLLTLPPPIIIGIEPGFEAPPWSVDFDVDLVTKSWAAFAQGTIEFFDQLQFTLGARTSRDEKKYTYATETVGLANLQLLMEVAPGAFMHVPIFGGSNFSFDDTLTYESFDPKFVVEWSPEFLSDAMFYGSYTQGYKSGGIQFIATQQELAEKSFDKEVLKSAELGVKSRWFNQRVQVNASLYSYDYADLQVQQIAVFEGTESIITDNAEKSIVEGFEGEVQFMASENLFLLASYNYIDATFDDFTTINGEDLSGNILPASPKHSYWLMAEYSRDISNYWGIKFQLDHSWKSSHYFESQNDFKQNSYDIYNLSFSFVTASDDLSIKLFCSNCGDEEYRTSVVALSTNQGWAATADRRRYGVGFKYSF